MKTPQTFEEAMIAVRAIPDQFTITRIRLNRDGYDRYGTYFGRDLPLFYVEFDGDPKTAGFGYTRPSWSDRHMRGIDRQDIRERLQDKFPGLKVAHDLDPLSIPLG